MTEVQSANQSYYEAEAHLGIRKPLVNQRVELRNVCIDLLTREGRHRVLDLGAGPGGDGRGFIDADIDFIGVDLAHANGVLAARNGITVVQGSIAAPPLAQRSFDAGWSMSTLMHVPDGEVVDTVAGMITPLQDGAPLMIGLWGGPLELLIGDSDIAGQQRYFHNRPLDANREVFATCGSVESATIWKTKASGEYQVFLVRIAS
ncbi:MAG: class I SAM-dependent methyltransferase [Actinobacteria bacterium]|nr:class I SAM-dependent methyltransferase [Actinomycetota bacterium]